jgi:putative redox protein
MCKQLASEGVGMLRFDNLGLGDSEGDWGDGSFSHKVADTVRAVEFMNDSGREVHLLVGHSFGGSAVIAAAHECDTVAAVASVGAPYDPAHVERNYDALLQRIEQDGEAPFLVGGKALTLKRHFIEDVRVADLHERIKTLRRALLVMHSPTDNTVGIANASEIFRAARHPRSFVSLEGADHLLTGKKQAARAARITSAWADPYL